MKKDIRYNLLKARKNGDLILPDGTIEKNTGRFGGRNTNMVIIGSSGSGKTHGCSKPLILSGAGGASMIVQDAKNDLHDSCYDELEKMGYEIIRLDFVYPDLSEGNYGLLENLQTPNDVQKIADMIVYAGTNRTCDMRDKYWNQLEITLLLACIGYILEKGKGISPDIAGVIKLISLFDPTARKNKKESYADRVFEYHREYYKKKTGKDSWAYEQYKKLMNDAENILSTVIFSAVADLSPLDTPELRKMLSKSNFDLLSAAHKKTAIFVNISDTDRSKDIALNIFYTQIMDRLCRYADSLPEKCLPVPIRFILDDFGSTVKIDGFESIISNIRSRGISVTILLQALAQLNQSYGAGMNTILTNCAIQVYTGGSDPETVRYFSDLAGKCDSVRNMPLLTNLIMRLGDRQGMFGKTVLLNEYELDEKKLAEAGIVSDER